MIGIGKRIKKLRERDQLTQVELANKLIITHQSISKWEREESIPDILMVIKLSKVFSISTDYLLLGLESDNSQLDINIKRNRPIMSFESLTDDELLTLFSVLVSDMPDEIKSSLHESGYLDVQYSYRWSEGKELVEIHWYKCSEAIIEASKSASSLDEVYDSVKKDHYIPRTLFTFMFDELVSIGKITKVTHLIREQDGLLS